MTLTSMIRAFFVVSAGHVKSVISALSHNCIPQCHAFDTAVFHSVFTFLCHLLCSAIVTLLCLSTSAQGSPVTCAALCCLHMTHRRFRFIISSS